MKTLSLLASLMVATLMTLRAGSVEDLTVKDINGKDVPLSDYKGQVLLIVNVASKCGNTPQYDALEQAYEKYKGQGFEVLGFPCNQFKNQEPGTNAQIMEFCTNTYHVKFPMFDKLEVNGANRAPLYNGLAGSDSPFPGDIKWNFTKFLRGPRRQDRPAFRAENQARLARSRAGHRDGAGGKVTFARRRGRFPCSVPRRVGIVGATYVDVERTEPVRSA